MMTSIQQGKMPDDMKEKCLSMVVRINKLIQYGSFSKEFEPVEKFISWVLKIPWGIYSNDNLDIKNVKQHLDATHFGLYEVKERIIEYVAMLNLLKRRENGGVATFTIDTTKAPEVPSDTESSSTLPVASMVHAADQNEPVMNIMGEFVTPETLDSSVAQVTPVVNPVNVAPEIIAPVNNTSSEVKPEEKSMSSEMSRLQGSSSHAPIICFVGVQGIGKTSIAKSIAAAMGKQFIRVSLGGLANVSELRGLSRGNFDASPGQIVKALIRTGVMNPLILLDEVDKVSDSNGTRSDVMAALLEILDPEQNSTFIDHYIDHPIDLSKVMFVCTANNLGGISAALLDRLEIIRMSSYSDEEKIHIAKDYLLPKVLGATGIDSKELMFDDDVWELVIRPLGFDAGIRQLERNLTTLARKIAKNIVTGAGSQYRVTRENFRQFFPMDFGVYS